MGGRFEALFDDLRSWAEARGIQVTTRPLGEETPAEFDGVSVTLNPDQDTESRCYYLAHSLGSIVAWSLDPKGATAVYARLRVAKANKGTDPGRLEPALAGFAAFEELASEYAVGLLESIGHGEVVPDYTAFARADLDAMLLFHGRGKGPVWREFFPDWKRKVSRGEVVVRPYRTRPIPPFRPVRIRNQEVVQETDDERS